MGLEDKFLILSFRDRRCPHCQTTKKRVTVDETRPGFNAPNDPGIDNRVFMLCPICQITAMVDGRATSESACTRGMDTLLLMKTDHRCLFHPSECFEVSFPT